MQLLVCSALAICDPLPLHVKEEERGRCKRGDMASQVPYNSRHAST